MTCRKCKGRGFYQTEISDGGRDVKLCDHEPDEKYNRMYETMKRIKEYEPYLEEEITHE